MATESFGLYVNQAMESGVSEEMRESVFRIIFDILLLYGVDILADKGHSVCLRPFPFAFHRNALTEQDNSRPTL